MIMGNASVQPAMRPQWMLRRSHRSASPARRSDSIDPLELVCMWLLNSDRILSAVVPDQLAADGHHAASPTQWLTYRATGTSFRAVLRAAIRMCSPYRVGDAHLEPAA
jgi:hypothetical protein